MKKCKECGKVKSFNDFHFDKSKLDGHVSYCKLCASERSKNWRSKNQLKVKEYFKAKYDSNPEKVIDRVRQWRQANPEKKERQNTTWKERHPMEYQAHNILNAAVRDGKIIKPSICENCDSKDNIHGHHTDYHKPLDVKWLCPKCHTRIHQVQEQS